MWELTPNTPWITIRPAIGVPLGRETYASSSWSSLAFSLTFSGIEISVSLWLSASSSMLFQDAEINHDEGARLARLLSRRLVNHAFLHPDRRRLDLDRLLDHFGHGVGPAENVDDIDLLGNVE